MQFNHRDSIGLCRRTRAEIARGNIELARARIDRWRAPHTSTQASVGHNVKDILNGTACRAQLEELPLTIRAISERGGAYIDAPFIDNRRAPYEGGRRATQRGLPYDSTIGGIQGIKTGVPTTDKDDQ